MLAAQKQISRPLLFTVTLLRHSMSRTRPKKWDYYGAINIVDDLPDGQIHSNLLHANFTLCHGSNDLPRGNEQLSVLATVTFIPAKGP